MTTKPDYVGTYKGLVLDTTLSKTKKGFPQFNVKVLLTEYWDQKEQEWFDVSDNKWVMTGYFNLYYRDGADENGEGGTVIETLNHRQICDVFGWDGRGFVYLVSTDFSDGMEVLVRTEEEEYNGKTSMRVKWIDKADADPNGGLKGIDVNEAKELEKEFEHLWASSKKPAKAASAKKAKKSEPKPEPESDEDHSEMTKEDRKKALLAKSKRLKDEANKQKEPPTKKSKDPEPETDVPDGYNKKRAWSDLIDIKDDDCDDETLKATWDAAIAEIADDGDEDNLDAEGWWAVKEQVAGEVGAF